MSYFYVTSSELRKKAGRITDLNRSEEHTSELQSLSC